MSTRQYQSAAPPPPDEGYWNALMHQEESESHITASAEESNWSDADAFQQTPLKSFEAYAGAPEDWENAQAALDHDETVYLTIIGHNKGGLLVEWQSLRGFVPASQLVDFSSEDLNNHQLATYIGKRLALRVIELNADNNRLIFSERAAQVSPGTRDAVLHDLQPDHISEGTVTNVTSFGAFVDLGGVEGLIHISELSWGRVEHPGEIVQRGQQVRVYILDVFPDEGRIALSLKRLQTDPWIDVDKRYHVGEVVQGVITSVVDFGAFTCLEEGLEGLIHISELAEGHFLHPRNVVCEGDVVSTKILNIDKSHRRIGLSLRALKNDAPPDTPSESF